MNDTRLPILYSFRRCPYAMRARMALIYCDISVELREVDLKNKPNELVQISPKATVPVLVHSDGSLLEESLDIIHWAMSVHDGNGLGALSHEQQKQSDLFITENDTEFKQWLDKYKYSQRFPEFSEVSYRQKGEIFLKKLELSLSNRLYLINDKLTYADIAIAPFIRQFSNVDVDWFTKSSYPLLVKWLNRLINSSVFIMAMKKHSVWINGNDKVIFP